MRKVLIVADSLSTGGLEKTLIDLCDNLDYEKFAVDLYLFAEGRDLLSRLNCNVKVLEDSPYFSDVFNKSVGDSVRTLLKKKKMGLALYRVIRFMKARLKIKNFSMLDWFFQKRTMLKIENEYDTAIAFAEGSACYYVAECIKANVKCMWIHTDIKEIVTNSSLDNRAFEVANYICTVSQNSAQSLKEFYPKHSRKIRVFTLPSLFDYKKIEDMANENCEMDRNVINILSVGRLVELKGFHLCTKALRQLLDDGYNVRWYVAGEGPYREVLEGLIEQYNLQEQFFLLGNKKNPYKYIKNSDICVQPSSYEGMSLVIYEEKYFKKPIVCTNIPSYLEMIEHNKNGLIVERNSDSIYEAIKILVEDGDLREKLGNSPANNYVEKIETVKAIENTIMG